MTSFLIFIGALLAIALIGWVVSKKTGSRAFYVDAWAFHEGEAVAWRDDRADVAVVPRLGRAASMRVLRLHRWSVVVINRRVIIGCKTLTGRHMVMYVLTFGPAPDGQTDKIDGGLLTRGYTTLAVHREAIVGPVDAKGRSAYIAFRPIAGANSSFNLAELRVYTASAVTIPVPSGVP
jgi:hypothetical protein